METTMTITPAHEPCAALHVCANDAAERAREALIALSNDVWPRNMGGSERQAQDLARFGYEVDPSTIRRLRSRTTKDVSLNLAAAIQHTADRVEIERENARIRRRNQSRMRLLG